MVNYSTCEIVDYVEGDEESHVRLSWRIHSDFLLVFLFCLFVFIYF